LHGGKPAIASVVVCFASSGAVTVILGGRGCQSG